MKTYEEVAKTVGLGESASRRYVNYMRKRWASEEDVHCAVGYAQEWAERFKVGIEYAASDSIGQAILRATP